MKLSQVLPEVIRLSQAISDYWETELPKRHPNYPLVYPGEDSGPPPPEEKTLRDLLDGLPEDALYKIALIMHLGFRALRNGQACLGIPEGEGGVRAAGSRRLPDWQRRRSLGDELSDGLEILGKAGIDVDKMNFKAARTRKSAQALGESSRRNTRGNGHAKELALVFQRPDGPSDTVAGRRQGPGLRTRPVADGQAGTPIWFVGAEPGGRGDVPVGVGSLY